MKISQVINKIIEDLPLEEAEKALLRSVDPDKLESDRLEFQTERDAFEREQADIQRRALVRDIAAQYAFADPAYLAFLAGDHNVDLTNADAVETFMTGLRDNSPKLFKIDINPGSATGIASPPPQSAGRLSGSGSSLAQLLADAPDCLD